MIHAAEDHDLAACLAFWLDEHRVHPHVGNDTGRERLEILRGADLTALDDARVVRHVLRLERNDVDAPSAKRTRERSRDDALPGRARRALHHQRAHRRSGSTNTRPSSRTTRTLAS